ncbi:MAG TPA: glycosyltransferase family 39 protein [Propionibacteriaceae bacterium]|nr:glycosyltransferase family 39 protein [Propionibacteriaceae bacterium]
MTSLISHPVTDRTTLEALDWRVGRHRSPRRRLESRHRRRIRAVLTSPWPWLAVIATAQVILSRVVPRNDGAFQDEGLYIYMGHRVLDLVRSGEPLFESPGSYFSGAPAFYPVLAALVDSVGGLQAARDLSLVFLIVTMGATYGLGKQLFGRLAGLLGAAAFAVNGPVIYLSQWATFDSMTLMLAALAAWLAVVSAKSEGLLRAPFVAMLLVAAVFAKYAGAMFVPIVAALAVAAGWSRFGWLVVRRAAFLVAASVTLFFFIVLLWGRGMLDGLAQTTTERHILNPTGQLELATQAATWIGPWLALALLGGILRLRRQPMVVLVLLGGSVLGPLQQIHLGEGTSLSKHVAFGLIFAAPLIGALLSTVLQVRAVLLRALLAPAVLALVCALAALGLQHSGRFLTAYPEDTQFREYLREAVAANPGKPILAEQSSAQRYELRDMTEPWQWADTYVFKYKGLTGPAAYERAIRERYFGVIYLNFTTKNSHQIVKFLGNSPVNGNYYHLAAQVPGYIHGDPAGFWLMWTPQSKRYTYIP